MLEAEFIHIEIFFPFFIGLPERLPFVSWYLGQERADQQVEKQAVLQFGILGSYRYNVAKSICLG
jgi:hypothetical protein